MLERVATRLKEAQIEKHPCFSKEAHFKHGRIHLPVSGACNIQCRFCIRSFNKTEIRPGVAGKLLKPEDAIAIMDKALDLCKEITVAGVAGPGDTLATPHALKTFQLIHEKYPHIINCLSTNGLNLSEYAKEVIQAGVKTITVTVNAVAPEVLKDICAYIIYKGKKIEGMEGARILIQKQLEGIRKATHYGAIIKINTVLIPGVNDFHIEAIARTVQEAGATMMNIIPLIPQHEFKNHSVPDCNTLNLARNIAEDYLPVFRHCRQCRADACGIPGQEDLSKLLYDSPMPTFSHG